MQAMSLGLVGKAIWKVNASVTLRASAKLSMMGWELELGGSQRVTEFSSAGYSVAAGSQVSPQLSRTYIHHSATAAWRNAQMEILLLPSCNSRAVEDMSCA